LLAGVDPRVYSEYVLAGLGVGGPRAANGGGSGAAMGAAGVAVARPVKPFQRRVKGRVAGGGARVADAAAAVAAETSSAGGSGGLKDFDRKEILEKLTRLAERYWDTLERQARTRSCARRRLELLKSKYGGKQGFVVEMRREYERQLDQIYTIYSILDSLEAKLKKIDPRVFKGYEDIGARAVWQSTLDEIARLKRELREALRHPEVYLVNPTFYQPYAEELSRIARDVAWIMSIVRHSKRQ